MSLDRARHLAHNLRARAIESGDKEVADMAHVLHEIADGLEREMRDIKNVLRDVQNRVQNLH